MNFKKSFIAILFLFNIMLHAQFEEKKIETDSSYIEVIKNSKYKVFNEIYKFKDAIWSRVTYINDTLKLNSEGWTTKEHHRLGVWKEYNENGELMYVRDYDKNICTINPKLYPYHNLLVEKKNKADNLIVQEYGKEFMKNYVAFEFDCSAYLNDKYVGSWVEPLIAKPNNFTFNYSIRLKKGDNPIYLRIEFDKNGNFVPQKYYSGYAGFEKIERRNKKFKISKDKAIAIANSQGMKNDNTNDIRQYLFWESSKNKAFYNGHFKYYITNLVDKVRYKESEERQGVIYKFDVYVFNPWTGKFTEKKKMKSIEEYGKLSGHTTGLLPDVE
ncbi:MAG: hypothetical protein K0M63_11450 [Weeksellaceae bacterium]|nr:hypothetical protein [Weeksellaceae bacterium]